MTKALGGQKADAPKSGFSQNPFSGLKYPESVGTQLTFRVLSKIDACYRFMYPTYKTDSQGDAKDGTSQINLSAPVWGAGQRSVIETSMIELYNFCQDLRKRQIQKSSQELNWDPDKTAKKINQARVFTNKDKYSWGPQGAVFGFEGVHKGVVDAYQIKSITYDPGNGPKMNEREFDSGVVHLLSESIEKEDVKYLKYTPFVSQLQLTARESKNLAFGNKYLAWEPSIICSEKYVGILPYEHFSDCAWVHPSDLEKVMAWLNQVVRGDVPEYRDWPDEDGNLVFVSTSHPGQNVKVNVVNDQTGITSELINEISTRPETFNFIPSTQHSLMGGYYIEKGGRQEVSESQIEQNMTGNFDDKGNPEIALNDQKYFVYHLEGKLRRNPLNPWVRDDEAEHVLKFADKIAEKARELGIPLKGDEIPLARDFRNLPTKKTEPAVSDSNSEKNESQQDVVAQDDDWLSQKPKKAESAANL